MMRRWTAGFTLLEIAVTLAVLGVVVTIAYGVFARVLEGKQRVEASADEAALARTVLGRITQELRAATFGSTKKLAASAGNPVPVGAPTQTAEAAGTPLGFVSQDHTEFSTPTDEMAFSTIVRRPVSLAASSSDLGVVHYFLRADDGRRDRFILARESLPSLSQDTVDLGEPAVGSSDDLLDNVVGLRLRFYDGEEWLEEWDSNAGRLVGKMPLAVEIWLALEAADGVVASYHTAVDLPVARLTAQTLQPQLAVGANQGAAADAAGAAAAGGQRSLLGGSPRR